MRNIPIIGKFLFILAIFGVFSVVGTVYSTSQMRFINSGYTSLRTGLTEASRNLVRANVDLNDMHAAIAQLMVDSTAVQTRADQNDLTRFRGRFTAFMQQVATEDPADAADVQALQTKALGVIDVGCATALQPAPAPAPAPAAVTAASAAAAPAAGPKNTQPANQAAYLNECAPKFPGLVANLMDLNTQVRRRDESAGAALTATTSSTITLTYLTVLGGLVVVMLCGFFAVRAWAVTPIKGLQAVMNRLSGGDLEAEVIGTDRKDEIGGMARAVQVFKDAGIEKQRLEAETEMQRAAVEQERQHVEHERAMAAQQQAFVVESVAAGLEKLSGGDLLFRLSEAFSSDYEKLRGDFNAAMETLQVTMQAIAANTQGVRSGAGEITQASDDLSRRTEQQAASLEETAAALDEITATVRRTAEVANEARDLVSTSKEDAERSGAVVRDTVQAMSGIETSSKQIGNIIGVIDEIAFQTNLLALNAGVEAARAGDAGRGFAVVATEVRALAQRSADAAKEIKALISASGQQVETGVKLVSETGHALGRIVTQVTQLNGLVVELAASAKEQATGLGEVNSAVNQMDQVTQQNAAMVEQATAASHSLANEAEELARLVGQFRIGEGAAAETTQRRAAPSSFAKPGAAAKRQIRKDKTNVVVLPHKTGADRAVATAGAAEDDWRDF